MNPFAERRAATTFSSRAVIYGVLVTSTARRALLAVVPVLAAVLLAPGPALADPPARLPAQVTDTAGALGSGRSAADAALADLQARTGIQLFVVFVDSFDGTPAQEWTDRTAALSDLGDRDALLAVATGDRAYAYSFPDDSRISDRELTDVAADDIEPALSRDDFAGAVVAAANGYTAAATGSSGSGLIWVAVIFVVIIVGAVVWVAVRRRRAAPATTATPTPTPTPEAEPAGPTIEELTARANDLLLELDDDLRASERELDLAAAQYGPAATERFRAALEASRADVAEAFRLRMTLDDGLSDADRRRALQQIVDRCTAADQRLDAESADFDRLRDLEGRAAEVAAQVEARIAALDLTAAEAAFQTLQARYAGPPVTAVASNVEQARDRLAFAAAALTQARAALAGAAAPTPDPAAPAATDPAAPADQAGPIPEPPGGDRAEAALAVRAAEQAVDQAEQLAAAVHQAGTDLAAARQAADALILEVEAELAAGRATLAGGDTPPPGLSPAVAGAEQVLAEVRATLAEPTSDPAAAAARLQAADSTLDLALAEARDAAERLARARSLLAQALPVARSQVAAADSFVTTRRGAVTTNARTSLSEAQRHLALAESLAVTDPVAAVAEAQEAQRMAAGASRSAQADVRSWDSGSYDQGSSGDDFLGAFLGGLLSGGYSSGGSRSGYRSRSRGGFSGGGFGGSSSRSRRTSGGGRRGGGGRF